MRDWVAVACSTYNRRRTRGMPFADPVRSHTVELATGTYVLVVDRAGVAQCCFRIRSSCLRVIPTHWPEELGLQPPHQAGGGRLGGPAELLRPAVG
jgi:hypothetical protein